MSWVEAFDGSIVNLDLVLGVFVREQSVAGANEKPEHAVSPTGLPWTLARGEQERLKELIQRVKAEIGSAGGRVATIDDLPERVDGSRDPVGAGPARPGQYL